jgi:hypothetical protein
LTREIKNNATLGKNATCDRGRIKVTVIDIRRVFHNWEGGKKQTLPLNPLPLTGQGNKFKKEGIFCVKIAAWIKEHINQNQKKELGFMDS